MKTVLIIGAMEEEILPFVEAGDFTTIDHKVFPYYKGEYEGANLIIAVSKIGKVAMASCVQHFITLVETAHMFSDYSIDLVINMGVAGAIASSLDQGDIVVGDKLCQHDMDVAGLGYEPGLNPDYKSIYFETGSDVVDLVKKAYDALDTNYKLEVGTIASGDQFISSKEKKDFIETTFSAYACEREGAALAQVCQDNDVPFLVIRAISDKADGEAPLSYNDFKTAAIVNLTELVRKTIELM